ncbi:MAG: DJ-1/PfpI family protein [Candidatus Woesearchaeota archaeon]|nr:MAG: DJ-1/PfpI family protein [Candidatus Woesearchaeota archaeon]
MSSKILMIIAQRNFRDEELSVTKKFLEQNGYSADVASFTTEIAKGMFGLTIKPDLSIEEAIDELEKYTVVIVVGGSGSLELAKREDVLELLRKAKDEDKIIAAICSGPLSLANAGLLRNKEATVWSSDTNQEQILEIEEKGAKYNKGPVVVDGNIITANGPEAAEAFAKKIVERLE